MITSSKVLVRLDVQQKNESRNLSLTIEATSKPRPSHVQATHFFYNMHSVVDIITYRIITYLLTVITFVIIRIYEITTSCDVSWRPATPNRAVECALAKKKSLSSINFYLLGYGVFSLEVLIMPHTCSTGYLST